MGYLSALIEAKFKEKRDGTTIFYPYGRMTKGKILLSTQSEKIKKFLKKFYGIYLPIVIGLCFVIPPSWIVLLVISFLIYHFRIKKLLSGSAQTGEKMSYFEKRKIIAREVGKKICIFSLISGTVFVALSICLLIFKREMIGVVGLIFFGFVTWQWFLIFEET